MPTIDITMRKGCSDQAIENCLLQIPQAAEDIPMMSEYGVKEEDLDRLADLAMQEMGYICNPVQPSKEELVEILKKMYVRA